MEENRINSLLQEVCKKLNINVDWYYKTLLFS